MKRFLFIISHLSIILSQSNNASLTIYKDGYALINQPVFWQLEDEQSSIFWDTLPSGIIKDSPFLALQNARIGSQRINEDIFHFEDRLNDLLGKYIDIKLIGERDASGILVEVSDKFITLKRRRSVISFNRDRIEYINAPGAIKNVRYKPYLRWEIFRDEALESTKGSLTYLSEGFEWEASYKLLIDPISSSGNLSVNAIIKNKSNLSFNNASLNVVEGMLKKEESFEPTSKSMRSKINENLKIKNMGLGDYYIYSLRDNIDLIQKENISINIYSPRKIIFNKTYIFENNEGSKKEEPLSIEYKIENNEKNNLGVPLPQGKIQFYQAMENGKIEFIGEDRIRQVPRESSATIVTGRAFDVVGKRIVLNYDRQRKSEEGSISIKVTNTLSEKIDVRLVEHIYGDWVIRNTSTNYRKEDASTIHFPISILANSFQTITYTYRKEWK